MLFHHHGRVLYTKNMLKIDNTTKKKICHFLQHEAFLLFTGTNTTTTTTTTAAAGAQNIYRFCSIFFKNQLGVQAPQENQTVTGL